MRILVYGHKIKEEDIAYLTSIDESIKEHDCKICIYEPYLRELVANNFFNWRQEATFNNYQDIAAWKPDVAVTIGGDGTILRIITLIRELQIPILGINLGRMGFLASVDKKTIKKALSKLLKNEFIAVSRSVLKLDSNIPVFADFPYALNDFTVSKRDTSSMITVHVYIDDTLLNSYWVDGLIISTPTGSTGYSLSCGGPIIFPNSGTFVITPIAPHNLNVRPVVIPDNHKLKLKVEGRTDNFMSTMDSRYETITSEHKITISKGEFRAQFVQLKGQSFMKTINDKLLWGLDKRN